MNTVTVSHIEIVQTIQNPLNEKYDETPLGGVPIIKNRRTFARVYFKDFSVDSDITVTGKLSIKNMKRLISAENKITWEKDVDQTLTQQRLSWSNSLNFDLTNRDIDEREIKLVELTTSTGKKIKINNKVTSSVCLEPKTTLKCRAVVFRYLNETRDEWLLPNDSEIDIARRYIEKTFPISELQWSSIRIQSFNDFHALGPIEQPTLESDTKTTRVLAHLLHQLLIVRNQDLMSGMDDRCLYLGLFVDPNNRFGGVAMDSPSFPTPHVVAAGVIDRSGETAAHELAHVLGREHPGIPSNQHHGFSISQAEVDTMAKFFVGEKGFISPLYSTTINDSINNAAESTERKPVDEENLYFGLDTDDSYLQPMVLENTNYFDLMTYRYPQWVSAYTYTGLYKRISEIEKADYSARTENSWTAICSFDLDKLSGSIETVLHTNFYTQQHDKEFSCVEHHLLESKLATLMEMAPKFPNLNLPEFCSEVQEELNTLDNKASSSDLLQCYNGCLEKMLEAHFGSNAEAIEMFKSHGLLCSVAASEIRIFVSYPNSINNPMPTDEEMWDEGTSLYYLRVGKNRDDRPLQGYCQYTVEEDSEGNSPVAVFLLINGTVVDRFKPGHSDADFANISKKIKKIIKDSPDLKPTEADVPLDQADKLTQEGLWLQYDADAGAHYLMFNWGSLNSSDISFDREPHSTPLTTFRCRRSESSEDLNTESIELPLEWETVAISSNLKDRIWLSPEFIGTKHNPDPDNADQSPIQGVLRKPEPAYFTDIQIEISLGFHKKVFYLQNDRLIDSLKKPTEPKPLKTVAGESDEVIPA